jgi:hypothetical protein
MAHPQPFRQYPGQNGGFRDPYGPPRGPPSRQGFNPRDQQNLDDGYDDRNYRNGPPQQPYPPRGGGPPPQQMRRPPQNGYPREDSYDRRGPPPQDGYPRGPVYNSPHQQGPRKPRPPMQALDLAGQHSERARRRPGADEYVALVSPSYDKRFEDDRRAYPPNSFNRQPPSPSNRMPPPSRNGPPGEPMPTMQFNMAVPPPRTKSAPPDDPRNWDRNGPPPPRQNRDPYDDRRGPPNMPMNGRGPPRGARPMDRPPYDRGPDPQRRSPPPRQQVPYDGRGPPPRSNTMPNDVYDPRGHPPRAYDARPSSRSNEYNDPRNNRPVNGNVDELLDDYLEELGSPIMEKRRSPSRQDPRRIDPRMDPRGDPRGEPRYDPRQQPRMNPGFERRTPPYSDTGADPYAPPDRRQLVHQATEPPGPGRLPRSQTAPGITDLDRGLQQMDLRRNTPPDLTGRRSRSPNKLHKSPPKQGPIGVQSQAITTVNGTIDPNALPTFPSPKSNADSHPRQTSVTSYSSDSSRPVPKKEKPKLTFALLEDYRRDAKDNPNDAAIQLDFAKALFEAGNVLAQESGMGDPKRVAKSRENYIQESYKIVKKLASSVIIPRN